MEEEKSSMSPISTEPTGSDDETMMEDAKDSLDVESPYGKDTLKTPSSASVLEKMKEHSEHTAVKTPVSAGTLEKMKMIADYKSIIDTAAPFESVKSAVSKFGGIVDWKAQKENHSHIMGELEKLQEEIPKYKLKSEAARIQRDTVLEELDTTNKLIDELRAALEKTQTEEAQAKQDSELAMLRVKELEQGISGEASAAAKAQLEVAKQRHEGAIEELKSVKKELESLHGDHQRLVSEREEAVAKAEAAVAAAKEAEKKAEDLTLELITLKSALESAHAMHLEAEERRIGLVMTRDKDMGTWERELSENNEEVQKLAGQPSSVEELKAKFDAASATLLNLKSELALFVEGRAMEDAGKVDKSLSPINPELAELASVKTELEEARVKMERASDEVNCLKEAAASLEAELEQEKEAIITLRQREGVASSTLSSLEAEISRVQSELELIHSKEKKQSKMEGLPSLVEQAAIEADQAKTLAQLARDELRKAREEAEKSKASAGTLEARLVATLKEAEAAKAAEALAIAAVKAIDGIDITVDESRCLVIPVEEYQKLSKNAADAEESAKKKVLAAIEKIDEAKKSEQVNMEKLEAACKDLEEKKDELKAAIELAENASAAKQAVEQELREKRAEMEQRRRASDLTASHSDEAHFGSPPGTAGEAGGSSRPRDGEASLRVNSMSCPDLYSDARSQEMKQPRRKKAFFPRIVMFLARKKAQSLK